MEREHVDDELKEEMYKAFTEVILRKYQYYCDRHRLKPSSAGLLMYVIASGVILSRTVSHYMVMELYPAALYRNSNAGEAYMDISAETGLSERHVRRMVKRPKRYSPEGRK